MQKWVQEVGPQLFAGYDQNCFGSGLTAYIILVSQLCVSPTKSYTQILNRYPLTSTQSP